MPTPPKLTPEQRKSALAKSTAARQVRAATKARVKAGELTLSAILELATSDEAIAKMRVVELLESFSGVGKVRAVATLDRLGNILRLLPNRNRDSAAISIKALYG